MKKSIRHSLFVCILCVSIIGAWSLLLFLAPHQVGFFRMSQFIPDGICSKKRVEYAENQALSGGISAILQSGLILKNIRRLTAKTFFECSQELDQIAE